MSEREPRQEGEVAVQRVKTHDVTYAYRGYSTEGGVCRIRIFQADGHPPVVIATELPENADTSITNLAEFVRCFTKQLIPVAERRGPERATPGSPAYLAVKANGNKSLL